MKVIHWNISYSSDKEKMLNTLLRLVRDEDAIVCLQEVQLSVKDFLVGKVYGSNGIKGAPYAYSWLESNIVQQLFPLERLRQCG